MQQMDLLNLCVSCGQVRCGDKKIVIVLTNDLKTMKALSYSYIIVFTCVFAQIEVCSI
jgi:hypothetical protein